jgi:hypothetical protein
LFILNDLTFLSLTALSFASPYAPAARKNPASARFVPRTPGPDDRFFLQYGPLFAPLYLYTSTKFGRPEHAPEPQYLLLLGLHEVDILPNAFLSLESAPFLAGILKMIYSFFGFFIFMRISRFAFGVGIFEPTMLLRFLASELMLSAGI